MFGIKKDNRVPLTREDVEGLLEEAGSPERLDLSGQNLAGADLRGINLTGANLHGADLHGANLSRADLTGARVTQEQLQNAIDLFGTIMPDGTTHP